MSRFAAPELQIHIRPRLSQPYTPLGLAKLDKTQLHLEQFDDAIEMAMIQAVGDVVRAGRTQAEVLNLLPPVPRVLDLISRQFA